MLNVRSILQYINIVLFIITSFMVIVSIITFPLWKESILPSKPVYFQTPTTMIYERNTIRNNDGNGYKDVVFQCYNVEGKINGKFFGKNMKCKRLY